MTRKQKVNNSSPINAAPPGLVRYATTRDWMPDRDGDGVVDPWDCVPWDPDQQGILSDAVAEARRIVSPHVSRAQRAYAGARSGVGRVIRRTYQTAHRVGATVARHSPSVQRTRTAIRYARAPVRELKKDYRYVTGKGATERYVTEGKGYRSEVIMKHPTLLGDIKKVAQPVTSVVAVSQPVTSAVAVPQDFMTMSPGERLAAVDRGERRYLAEHSDAAPQMSQTSMDIHEKTAQVARVARGFEGSVDKPVRDVERAFGMHSEKIPSWARWTGAQVKGLGYGIAFHGPAAAVEMAGMIPGGVETIARKPSIVAPAAVFGMYTMGKGMFEGLTQRPGQTIGELITVGAISKGTPKIPVPKKVTGLVPTLKIGVPTPKGLAPGKAIKFEAGLKVARGLAKADPPVKRPLDFTEIESLPGKSGLILEKWIKAHPEQEPVIFGSGAARTQLKVSRKPGDADIFVVDEALAAKEVGALLTQELGKANVRVKKGGMVETRVGGKWDHAVDFHSGSEMTGRMTLGFETQPPVEIGGIKYTRISEQLTRKGMSVLEAHSPVLVKTKMGLEFSKKGPQSIITPPHHRVAKDVGDFLSISEQLIASRKAAAGSSWLLSGYKMRRATKLQEALRTYETHGYIYPDPVPAIRGYYALPRAIRTPGYVVAAVGVGTRYPTYPKTVSPKYPKLVSPKYPKLVSPKYPKLVSPKYPKYPKTGKTEYPKYPKTGKTEYPKYPKTGKTEYPKYPKTGKTEYPKTGKIELPKTYKIVDDTRILRLSVGKKRKLKAKAKEERVFTGDPIKHVLVTLESFAGRAGAKKGKMSPMNIV